MSPAPDPFDPVTIALAEDVGTGDLTTTYFVGEKEQASARIFARQRAVVAGSETAAQVFRQVDETLHVKVIRPDGSLVHDGETVLEVHGSARAILTAERVALNFLQRLSGIATLTRQFVDAVAGTRAQILDTRKTTPGLRRLEKAAVRAGGGVNHRFGLFDMVMVKDNHLLARPRIEEIAACIQRLQSERPDVRIELEADELSQVIALLEIEGIEVVLLDNMPLAEMREAVRVGDGRVKFEASGGVTLQYVREIAATGVDFISVGALTHSAPAVDFSLELTHVAT